MPEMRASGWIGLPPASAADIAAAQARLERSLPQSCQAFLAITDGWPVLSFDFGQVRPVAELDWVAAADPGFYEVVCADHYSCQENSLPSGRSLKSTPSPPWLFCCQINNTLPLGSRITNRSLSGSNGSESFLVVWSST